MAKRPWSRFEKALLIITGVGALAFPFGVRLWSAAQIPSEDGGARRGSKYPLACLAWSPDSTMVAAAGGQNASARSSSVLVWKTEGPLMYNLSGHKMAVRQVEFSPDNRYLISSSDDDVCIWNADAGTLAHAVPTSTLTSRWEKSNSVLVIDGNVSTPTAPNTVTVRPAESRIDLRRKTETQLPFPPLKVTVLKKQFSPGKSFSFSRPHSLFPKALMHDVTFQSGYYVGGGSLPLAFRNKLLLNPEERPKKLDEIRVHRTSDKVLIKTFDDDEIKQLWWKDARHLCGVFVRRVNARFQEARLWDFDCQTDEEAWQHLDVKDFDDAHVSSDKRWMSWDEITKVRLFDLKRKVFVSVWETEPEGRTKSAFSPDSSDIAWLDGDALRVQRLDAFTKS